MQHLVGSLFILVGVVSIIRREVEIGGEHGPPVAVLRGLPAVLVGIGVVVAGIAMFTIE